MMMDLDFITLIHKELTGDLSASEAKTLSEWKSSNDDNMATYQDTVEIWKFTAGYTPKLEVNVANAFESQMARIRKESAIAETAPVAETKVISLKPRSWMLRVAAIAVVVLSATILFKSNQGLSFAAGDDIKYVQLSDGSSIWLDRNSTLEIDDSFGTVTRSVTLEGKAFFDIARDENRPFIIDANQVDIEVLGTSFTVDATDSTPSVAVRSGKVKVTSTNDSATLTKGQGVESSTDGNLDESTVDIATEFTWTNKDLSFQDAPLSQVLADLGKHFNKEFNYKGGLNLDSCPFTSKSLKGISLGDVLDILELTYDMKVDIKSDKEIRLTRIKCRR